MAEGTVDGIVANCYCLYPLTDGSCHFFNGMFLLAILCSVYFWPGSIIALTR